MKIIPLATACQRFPYENLKELATFGALREQATINLLAAGRVLQLDAAESLFDANSKPTAFYIILEGEIALYRRYGRKSALTRTYQKGEQIGFASIIALHPREGAAIAARPSCVLEIPAEHFFSMYDAATEDFAVLMLNLARGMARTIGVLGKTIAELRNQG